MGENSSSQTRRAFISNLTSAEEEAALVQQRRDKSSLDHKGTPKTVEETTVAVKEKVMDVTLLDANLGYYLSTRHVLETRE